MWHIFHFACRSLKQLPEVVDGGVMMSNMLKGISSYNMWKFGT